MSRLPTPIEITEPDPQAEIRAARLVLRCCGPDAPGILAMLGLDDPAPPGGAGA